MKNSKIKKIISIALVMITVLGTISVTASAASYSTGIYVITPSNGLNVRPEPNSSSRVGAASKGVQFEVTRISGNWGYTPSIKCTNGSRSGWVCLDYCSMVKKTTSNTASATYPTGNYMIGSKDGSNIRTGAGTNYSKVGASKYGTVFRVSQVKGNWGYTSSIQCTNGTKSGWVCLDYCTYKGSGSSSTTKPSNSSATVKLNVPFYKQSDSRWKNVKIGTKTIGQIGCTTTCIAMVYSYNTGKTVYPNKVKNMLRYSNNDLYWSSIGNVGLTSKVYNCSVSNSMLKTIYNKLKEGRPVIIGAVVPGGASQHWVVITGYTGSSTTNFSTADFTINDPGYQNCSTLKAFLANGSGADRTKVIRIMY